MTIVDKFAVGDKVKLSEFYQYNYSPKWIATVKDKVAEIKAVKQRAIPFASLDKEDKPIYRNRYGQLNEYQLYQLTIQFEGMEGMYYVSQFGVEPV